MLMPARPITRFHGLSGWRHPRRWGCSPGSEALAARPYSGVDMNVVVERVPARVAVLSDGFLLMTPKLKDRV